MYIIQYNRFCDTTDIHVLSHNIETLDYKIPLTRINSEVNDARVSIQSYVQLTGEVGENVTETHLSEG